MNLTDLIQTGGGGGLPESFMNDMYMFMAEQNFVNNTRQIEYDNGMFDILRNEDKILSSSNVVITDMENDLDADGKVELDTNTNTVVYNSESFSVASQDTAPFSLTFNSDGSKMFILGVNNDTVFAYDLGTNFNVSTAVYNSESFSVASQETTPFSVAFNSDGSKMYIVGIINDTVFAYDLGTNFNVSTAVYNSESFSVASQETTPFSVAFNSDGSKMYIVGTTNDTVFAYDLGTNFNVSTAVYNSEFFDVSSQETSPYSVAFNSDGSKMFIVGTTNNTVFAYDLGTNFDVSTAVYNSESFSVASQETTSYSVTFNSDGSKMYIVGDTNNTVFAYDLGALYSFEDIYFSSGNIESISKDLGFTPSKIILSDEVSLNAESVTYTIEDENSNTVTVSRSELNTEIDLTDITGTEITITANLSQTGGNTPTLYGYAAYFKR